MAALKTLEDVRYAQDELGFAVDEYLRARGWRHTCDNPASLWLWEGRLMDGRVVLVDRETALRFIQTSGESNPTGEET